MAEQAGSTRESLRDNLATTARVYDAYPERVEALAALVATHLERDSAGPQSGGSAGADPSGELDSALARFDHAFRGLVADPQYKQIVQGLIAEYTPPPYTQLPGESATEGEPVTAGLAALAIAGGALVGSLIGAAIPIPL